MTVLVAPWPLSTVRRPRGLGGGGPTHRSDRKGLDVLRQSAFALLGRENGRYREKETRTFRVAPVCNPR